MEKLGFNDVQVHIIGNDTYLQDMLCISLAGTYFTNGAP